MNIDKTNAKDVLDQILTKVKAHLHTEREPALFRGISLTPKKGN
jgi:hypothetical protein